MMTKGMTFFTAWYISAGYFAVALHGTENHEDWLIVALFAWWGLGGIIGWLIDTSDEGWRHK